MIDLSDKQTLSTLTMALRRALNSLDNEIATVDYGIGLTRSQRSVKLELLRQSRQDILAIYAKLLLAKG
jgi:hypothetical protein